MLLTLRKNNPLKAAKCVRVTSLRDFEESFILKLLLEDGAIQLNKETVSIILHNIENNRGVTTTRSLCRPLYLRWEKVSDEDKDKVPGSFRVWNDTTAEAAFIVDNGVCFYKDQSSLDNLAVAKCIRVESADDLQKSSIGRMLILDGAIQLLTNDRGKTTVVLNNMDSSGYTTSISKSITSPTFIRWDEVPEKYRDRSQRKYYACVEQYGNMLYNVANNFCFKTGERFMACKISFHMPSWLRNPRLYVQFAGSTMFIRNSEDEELQAGEVGRDYLITDLPSRTHVDIIPVYSSTAKEYLVCEMNGKETPLLAYAK